MEANPLSDKLSRRALVASAAGTLALAVDPASAQRCPSTPPPRTKGPLVFRDMDQQDLDEAFDPSLNAFNSQTVNQRSTALDIAARGRLGAPLAAAYGTLQIERVLVYRTKSANAPILMYFHDGNWTQGVARYAAIAEVAVKAGAHFADVDFSGVADVGGDLNRLVDQCRRAVGFVYRNANNFGGDPNRLYLAGFGSGAHLAACVLTTDWAQEGLPADLIKGAFLGSGIYDLKPVRLSSRFSAVKFTDEIEEALSPNSTSIGFARRSPSLTERSTPPNTSVNHASSRWHCSWRGELRTPWSEEATITSSCWRRCAIPTASTAGPHWR